MARNLTSATCEEITSDCTTVSYDHPEILERETLVDVLCTKGIDRQEINALDKVDLVKLFYKYAAPLPQRAQQLRRAKRKPPKPSEHQPSASPKDIVIGSRKRALTSEGPLRSKLYRPDDFSKIIINKGPSKQKNKTDIPMQTSKNDLSPMSQDSSKVTKLKRSTPEPPKSKPVKLNRRSFTNHPSDGNKTTHAGTITQQSKHVEVCKSDSDSMDEDIVEVKTQFQKVAVKWP
ncbi:predicted protein [Nematostella vectensis]|uniref:Ashwin n=1 Tax=Nematostella vectensis TaxID=45351 RepID=A7SC65_NEMVE|nr:uncharacterized protein LOC5510270 [Nematostella vectensis]EDO38705.1 predicted protein [Nematostella vectensis]|eukprot:XP_001630768.1 predicted protein [Nematostella vectensis]